MDNLEADGGVECWSHEIKRKRRYGHEHIHTWSEMLINQTLQLDTKPDYMLSLSLQMSMIIKLKPRKQFKVTGKTTQKAKEINSLIPIRRL